MNEKLRTYFTKPYIKKYLLYILAMILLGTSVAMLQLSNAGMSAWDALHRNFYEGIPMDYKYVNTISALLLTTLAYIIAKKKFNLIMLFPVAISFFIGAIIDFELVYLIPDVTSLSWIYSVIYLAIAIVLVGIGLNIIIYCDFPLPAIDQICEAIANRLKVSFGKGKLIGEIIALVGTVLVGVYYQSQEYYFYFGFTTIFYIMFLGMVVDFFRNPIFRFLKGIPKIELYADDLTEEDTSRNSLRIACRAIILKDNKIMINFHKKASFYMLPGGGKQAKENLEKCLTREVLEETGYKIKVRHEKLIINEYFMDSSHQNHYFIANLKSDKVYTRLINQTEAEINQEIETLWIDKDELLDILNNHETKDEFAPQIMWREFLGIINAL